MTYKKLKTLVSGLLIGDNKIPNDNEQLLALLEMAYGYLMDNCQVLNLHTLDKSSEIHRIGLGEYVVRKPELPATDDDELDVDDSLGSVVASLLASYISDKKTPIHQARADNGIKSHNARVYEILETLGDVNED